MGTLKSGSCVVVPRCRVPTIAVLQDLTFSLASTSLCELVRVFITGTVVRPTINSALRPFLSRAVASVNIAPATSHFRGWVELRWYYDIFVNMSHGSTVSPTNPHQGAAHKSYLSSKDTTQRISNVEAVFFLCGFALFRSVVNIFCIDC